MILQWTETNGAHSASAFGIKFYIRQDRHTERCGGRDYSLRIEFNSTGAWILSERVFDSIEDPTIFKEQAEKIADAVQAAIDAACAERVKPLVEALKGIFSLNARAYGNSSFHGKTVRMCEEALAAERERSKT